MYKLFVFAVVALLVGGGLAQECQPSTAVPNACELPRQTTLTQEIEQCIRDCPVTPEYNPVCGTNRVLYSNPGRLYCAQACGVNVSQLRMGNCPRN